MAYSKLAAAITGCAIICLFAVASPGHAAVAPIVLCSVEDGFTCGQDGSKCRPASALRGRRFLFDTVAGVQTITAMTGKGWRKIDEQFQLTRRVEAAPGRLERLEFRLGSYDSHVFVIYETGRFSISEHWAEGYVSVEAGLCSPYKLGTEW